MKKAQGKGPRFLGQTYSYNLGALAGTKEIGVLGTTSGVYFVGYATIKKMAVRLNVNVLPTSSDPVELQAVLDDWASELGLNTWEKGAPW